MALGAISANTASAAVEPAPASGSTPVYGDVDGDGTQDRIVVQPTRIGGWELRVDLASGPLYAPLPDDDLIPEVGPRVTDVNSNGIDEVMVPVSVGANTVEFRLFVYAGAPVDDLAQVTLPDGAALRLFEGGGIAAVSGYSCPADHDGRTLNVVNGSLSDDSTGDELRYDGTTTTFAVDGTVADPLYVGEFTGVLRSDPVLETDPGSCAPA